MDTDAGAGMLEFEQDFTYNMEAGRDIDPRDLDLEKKLMARNQIENDAMTMRHISPPLNKDPIRRFVAFMLAED